ncbi:YccF domain-containing protein [Streptococcus castoreus]|uniref:YccF domain-containing protein n=1 Tax=Streptococcus castoreus TaxID=254786 RepID=UPI00041D4B8F|nr:YccF domain-containing protein [Streptococcus castoreus]
MTSIANIIWFILSGFWAWLVWSFLGILFCLTIVGIPFGFQCFKIGNFGLFPFGKAIDIGTGIGSLLLNLFWILLCGWELAILHLTSAFLLCLTVIGIPFASQCLKLALISLFPFGARVKHL